LTSWPLTGRKAEVDAITDALEQREELWVALGFGT